MPEQLQTTPRLLTVERYAWSEFQTQDRERKLPYLLV